MNLLLRVADWKLQSLPPQAPLCAARLTLARDQGKGAIAPAIAGPFSFSATSSKYDHVPPGTARIEFSAQLPAIFTVRLLPLRKYSGSWGVVPLPKIPGTLRIGSISSTDFASLLLSLFLFLPPSASLSLPLTPAGNVRGRFICWFGVSISPISSRVSSISVKPRAKNLISPSPCR